ncbi:acyl carrier protein [Hutsoniella sourekii]|uniref:acyl carrier protein n=1 Tax=Hutsoniella sourekii TaxID=87650 RepID=UPI000481E873|nr:acyl carrier protein [Hutsoniella sourekii]
MNQQIFNDVKSMIVERFGVQDESVTESMSFDDLGADSLDVVELVMELEDKYNIQFEDDKIEKLNTIGDAVNYIDQVR